LRALRLTNLKGGHTMVCFNVNSSLLWLSERRW